jgi:hypothetical protein
MGFYRFVPYREQVTYIIFVYTLYSSLKKADLSNIVAEFLKNVILNLFTAEMLYQKFWV